MGTESGQITVFGEVLFDCFPDGAKVLGGAPFNVAWHLQAFGQGPCFVSRVGSDVEGEAITRAMASWGMRREGLQLDTDHPTGQVQVSLNGGEPSYEIVDRVAYDFIDPEALGSQPCRILYHGSLCLRHSMPRAALERLRKQAQPTVFMDVNLRQPWWQREEVLHWVGQADWVKLNGDELDALQDGTGDPNTRAQAFFDRHRLSGLIVTRGEAGASLLSRGESPVDVAPQAALQVVDTVGAGDALSSVLLLGIGHGWPMEETLERAQQFASAVVGQRGATIQERSFYQPFLESWGLADAD